MSSRSVVITSEGLRKVSQAIKEMGGTLDNACRVTGVPVLDMQTLIDRRLPISRHHARQIISALRIPFDESLLTEPIELLFEETKEEERKRKSATQRKELVKRILSATQENRRNQIVVEEAAEELSEARPDDVQSITSAQLKILASYYNEGLSQAKASFRWAATVSVIGFAFFITAVIFVLDSQPQDQTLIPLISGAVVEAVAGINFYLYGQATKQLATFQKKLNQTQRFLLANSICESLKGESQQIARIELIKTVSSSPD